MKRTGMMLLLGSMVFCLLWDGAALGFVLSVDITSLSTPVGGSETITINDGTAPYTAVSNNESVATVLVDANVVTWTGVAEGTASVNIEDSAGNSVIAAVTVSGTPPPVDAELSMTAGVPLLVTLSEGELKIVPITGGSGFYSITVSTEGVAVATLSGNLLAMAGLAEGSTVITLADSDGNTATVELTVNTVVDVAPSALTLAVGATGTLAVSKGTGFYNVSSSDTDVALAFLNGESVLVSAVGEGTAVITVTDSSGGTSASTITVVEEIRILSFLVGATAATSTAITTFEGKEETLSLRDGSGFYNVTSSDENVARGSMGNDTLVITAVTAGTAVLTVTDSTGKSVTADVTVKQVLFASVEELVLQAGGTGSFTVSNSNNFINVVTSASSVATALWSGDQVTVTAVSEGTATLTVKENDVSLDSVEVTVVNLFPPVLTATVSGGSVTLSWPAVLGATGYMLYAAPSEDAGPDSLISLDLGNITTKSYELFSGFDYIVALKAYDDEDQSDYSNVENVVLP